MSDAQRKSVVILGAGFGGIAAALALARKGPGKERCRVTVVDRSPFHTFSPLLYEAATGFIEHENVGSAKLLRSGVAIETAALLSPHGVDFVEDEVTGIDWERRQVMLRDGQIGFDYVIIALGAETNYFGIKGMQENAYVLKTARDADRLRQRVHDLLHMKAEGKREEVNVVIGGGGATGVELASELTMFLRQHLAKKHLRPSDFHILLVEAQSRVLAAMDPDLSAFALKRLKTLGVHVHLDTAVKEVMHGKVTLAPRPCRPGETVDQLLCEFKHDGAKTVDADLVVWSGGIRGSSTLERLDVTLDERGRRIPVDASLAVPGRTDAFAIGDSALLMDPKTKLPVPWLAQAAMVMGRTAADSVINRMAARPDASYRFPTYPVVVPLGGKFAAAKVGGRKLRGLPGWVIHELAALRYFMSILPFWSAIGLWWRGTVMYAKND
jgi:NADH dehydrogenase